MSVFRDEHEQGKNRVKNPKRVFSAKQAHKKWKSSYRRGAEKMTRLEQLNRKYENAISEAKVEDKNTVTRYAKVALETIPVAFIVEGAEDNLNDYTIAMMVTEDGNALYTHESQDADDLTAKDTFEALSNDIKVLAEGFDREIKNILSRNGLVKKGN